MKRGGMGAVRIRETYLRGDRLLLSVSDTVLGAANRPHAGKVLLFILCLLASSLHNLDTWYMKSIHDLDSRPLGSDFSCSRGSEPPTPSQRWVGRRYPIQMIHAMLTESTLLKHHNAVCTRAPPGWGLHPDPPAWEREGFACKQRLKGRWYQGKGRLWLNVEMFAKCKVRLLIK